MLDNICATIILYNPDESIFENIASYITDIDKLVVVDNSDTNNKKIIDKLLDLYPDIIYINNNENLGIATALNIACDKAIELQFDWIITMDQDSKFIDCKKFLLCANGIISNELDVGLITPNHTSNLNSIQNKPDCTFEKKEMVITSGNLINLSYFNNIGRFNDKLFIDMVDYDFSNKMLLNHLKILFLKNHYILHSIGDIFKRKNILSAKVKEKIEHNAQRVYYMTRNRLFLSSFYRKTFPKEFGILKTLNILYIHDITKIILYEDKKASKLYAKFLALYHFTIGKMGRHTI